MPSLYTRTARRRAAAPTLARIADLARKAARLLLRAACAGDVAAGAQWFRMVKALCARARAVRGWVEGAG